MKNLKSVLIAINFIFLALSSAAQDTLVYSSAAGIHARGMMLYKNKLIVGTNTGAIFSIKNGKSKEIHAASKHKEIRDITATNKGWMAMSSGDSSALLFFKRNRLKQIESSLFNGIFLDGIDSKGDVVFIMGDPNQKGDLSLYYSTDGGKSIQLVPNRVHAKKEEAAFAASGTTVFVEDENKWFFVTGGGSSRLIQTQDGGQNWSIHTLPYPRCSSCGPYSISKINDSSFVCVGGDYQNEAVGKTSCFWSNDGGKTWQEPVQTVGGYRSCILRVNQTLYVCGTTGLDFSRDKGKTWESIAQGNFLSMVSDGEKLYVSASKGRIITFQLKEP